VTTFQYEHGFYNRLEREFYGYGKVIEEQRDAANGEAVYRQIVREFANDSYFTKGLLTREVTQDASGRPFVETENTYLLRNVETEVSRPMPKHDRDALPAASPHRSALLRGQFDAGQDDLRHTDIRRARQRDRTVRRGDVGAQDDTLSTIEYSACADTYIVGTPIRIVVTGNGAVMRQREAMVDCASGDVTQVRQYLASGEAAVTDLSYFPNGNLQQVTDPPNCTAALPAHLRIRSGRANARGADHRHLGYSSTATYNYHYGVVATSTDLNQNSIGYAYDQFGRLVTVIGPYEQGGTRPTISFEYHPEAAVPWRIRGTSMPSAAGTIR